MQCRGRPVLFIKPPSSLIGLDEGISWNPAWGSCHFECEFVLRIDQPLKGETDPQKVLQAIGAVTLGLDLTLRDLQNELKIKANLGKEQRLLMVHVCLQTG